MGADGGVGDSVSERLFVALEIPGWLQRELAELVALAAADGAFPKARWVPARNLHLTLLFLGQQPSGVVAALAEGLRRATSELPSIDTEIERFGAFPPDRRARIEGSRGGTRKKVLWLGLRPVAGLRALHAEVCSAALWSIPGLVLEDRPFVPHLTLARCRPPWPRGDFLRAARHFAAIVGQSVRLETLHVMKSTTDRRGAVYSSLAQLRLT